MRVSDANAATRVGRWAHNNRDILPVGLLRDVADLADTARQKMLVGLTDQQLAELRGES